MFLAQLAEGAGEKRHLCRASGLQVLTQGGLAGRAQGIQHAQPIGEIILRKRDLLKRRQSHDLPHSGDHDLARTAGLLNGAVIPFKDSHHLIDAHI